MHLYGMCIPSSYLHVTCQLLLKSSVLKTFIHDPLVEWEKVKGRPASAEATNEKVKMCINVM
jgi:hypothetical protein